MILSWYNTIFPLPSTMRSWAFLHFVNIQKVVFIFFLKKWCWVGPLRIGFESMFSLFFMSYAYFLQLKVWMLLLGLYINLSNNEHVFICFPPSALSDCDWKNIVYVFITRSLVIGLMEFHFFEHLRCLIFWKICMWLFLYQPKSQCTVC